MKFEPYPLQFSPIFKERIWGGNKLNTTLNKNISSGNIGESWELSTVGADISVIVNGEYQGKNLTEIIDQFPEALLGGEVYKRFGKQFPLLFKFIDASQDLSIQVHPNDALAKKRHNSFGKTEMWYIMEADKNARIIVGFNKPSNPEEYLSHLKSATLPAILDQVNVSQGEVFFLDTGTVHAIGAGILLAEIQQTSDITYRIYDWDRVDADGNSRELHTDLAIDAINFDVVTSQRVYSKVANQSNPVVNCQYFTTNFIPLSGHTEVRKNGNSFTVYMCVAGSFSLVFKSQSHSYSTGDTILVPAEILAFSLEGEASILEIFIS